ncbi:siroheme synthase CysG [Pannonibacter indicus]|uniref:siroheme synthase CysG n=1 Tax=Pannonibacter indicus TaxID=466044 RepID=UPI0035B20C87
MTMLHVQPETSGLSPRSARPQRPTRMEPLAVLPVFLPLTGRKAVLAGGGEPAAWKAELLLAAGVELHLFTDSPCEDLVALLADPALSPRIHHACRIWQPEDLTGAALAIADAEDDEDAAAFFAAARAAGVPVNVIDRPAFCQFQFGGIVNRSPLVVGISTDGAAPVLGQTVRQKIETLLPPGLSRWAQLAARIRAAVSERLESVALRRRFWRQFSEAAFARGAPELEEDFGALIDHLAEEAPATGEVVLVGAGPGDAAHLTLGAMRALQSADVILFDDLVSAEVLELARREAKRMLVGKRGGRESCAQEDINDMMVSLARQGRKVVRLKSGDPMVFGRAGEEIARLEAEGIPVSVVPGITAASAMAARLKVSLTHRDHAQSLRLMTAHSRHGGLPDTLDLSGRATSASTTVFYMGRRMADSLRQRLLSEGVSPDLPVVAHGSVSRPEEKIWTGRLADLTSTAMAAFGEAPVLIGIGQVFAAAKAGEEEAGLPVVAAQVQARKVRA